MPDPEKFVRPKEELRISAASWNGLMQMLRDYNRNGRKGRQLKGGVQGSLLKSNIEVYVQNLTGGPWEEAFKVVRLSNSLLDLTGDTLHKVNKDPILGAFVPLSETDAIGITQRPSESSPSNGVIVPAVIMGVTVCRIRMLDPSHIWANPVSGDIDSLESSAECGQARILYHVAEESGDLSLAIVNLIGSGPCESTGSGGSPPDYEAGGPGWVAGLCADNCLKMRVMSSYGLCGSIDLSQVIPLTSGDGSSWVSMCDFNYCDLTPDSGAGECEGSGEVTFTRNGGGGYPSASIDGYTLIYNAAGRSGGNAWIEFAGGQDLCAGCPDPVEVSGPCGPEEEPGNNCCGNNGGCGSNYFVVRFECAKCPVDGWNCPAWYCVTSGCCETDLPEPMYVDTDLAMSEAAPRICSGPYETEEEALAVCSEFACIPPPGGTSVCGSVAGGFFDPFEEGTKDFCWPANGDGFPTPAISPTHIINLYGLYGTASGATIDIIMVDPEPGQEINVYEQCQFGTTLTTLVTSINAGNPSDSVVLPPGAIWFLEIKRPYVPPTDPVDPYLNMRITNTFS